MKGRCNAWFPGETMEDEVNKMVPNGEGPVTTTVVESEDQSSHKEPQAQIQDNVSPELEKIQKTQHVKKNKGRPDQKVTYMKDEGLPQDMKLIGQEYIREELKKPLSVLFYFFLPIIMILPVINLVLIFTWTFGRYVNANLRRIGIASMLWVILMIVITILFGESIFVFFSDWYETMFG